ncbi:MFS transporter [Olea europaea subsp. europaea]|uniref:MFS transporter n=1 Tax=Olea europaea subsp. europaea TaxID=158383 RepID=A0A8S0RS40_OLEEU|nr:MFS transporter [Olea europaea subsp. europaea]
MGSGALVLVWSLRSVIAIPAFLMSAQRRERPQPRREWASDCGVRGDRGCGKQGASGERLVGRDREKYASAARRFYSRPTTLNFGVLMGSGALVLVWSHQSVIAVRAFFMSVQRRERSKPRKDRASDCRVRGARGDRKRGASEERLEGRDSGKNCFSGEKGKKKLYKRRKGVQHEDFPRAQPSLYYSRPSMLNFGVQMGSGALVLVWSHPSVIAIRAYLMLVQRRERP